MHLRATFDRAALLYDEARPGYPEALFDDVISLSSIPPDGRILEIGCGTGQATLPFARRGYRIHCIELGANLAAVARHKLAAYPRAEVHTGAFEEWPVEDGAFDLAIAATAFHWLDPAIAYPKIAHALRPGGAVALFLNLHVHSEASEGFFEAVQEVYLREVYETAKDYPPLPRAEEVPEKVKDEIERTNLFGPVTVRKYRWDAAYDSASYIRVLSTYSGNINLDSATRDRLFGGIAELIDTKFGGCITKGYLTTLYTAQRK